MKFLTAIGKMLAILMCLGLMQPCFVQEVSAKTVKKDQSTKKSSTKKVSVKKTTAKKTAAKSVKKSAPSENAEKNLWMKRARESTVLTGKASWYGSDFHNKKTASGVKYDMHTFTAAHRTLPMGTVVKVTDQSNGKSVMVCVTDRGPYVAGRIIDLSYAAAKKLDLNERGVGKVALEVVSDTKGKPLAGDKAYFVKYTSDNGKTRVGPFHAFADATAMQQALTQAHPEVEVVLERINAK